MKNKRRLFKKHSSYKDERMCSFQDEDNECLMGKPVGCSCQFCLKPDQITFKQPPVRNLNQHYQTNFNISVRNAYSFVLVHLKNDDNKNPLGLLIPDICIFHETTPYDIYYSSQGQIRGYKTIDTYKIKLMDLQKILKQLSNRPGQQQPNAKQMYIARFTNNEYIMLSDIDLDQVCYKRRNDPFWQKLEYICNKMPVQSHQPIIRSYSNAIEYPQSIVKLAAQCMVGYVDDNSVREILDEQSYLDYCNIKICNLLNYNHNIRVIKADFSYVRTYSNSYLFVNVEHLEHSNLTQALKKREDRLENQMLKKNDKIILTPRREERLKHMQFTPMVKVLENKMNNQFEGQLKQFNFSSADFSTNEQTKNELAFKKLHPHIAVEFKQMLFTSNWQQIKDKVFGDNKRRPLISQSKTRSFSFFQPQVSKPNFYPPKLKTHPKRKRASQSSVNKQRTTTDFNVHNRFGTIRTEAISLHPYWL